VRLPVHEHETVARAHLVRVRAGLHFDRGELARPRWIADVDDGGAVRCLHVRDERHPSVDDHLPAAGAIEVADLPHASGASAVATHAVSLPAEVAAVYQDSGQRLAYSTAP